MTAPRLAHVTDLPLPHVPGALPTWLAQQLTFFGRPTLPPGVRWALLLDGRSTPVLAAKPWAFETLADLARSIHRRRRGQRILLRDVDLTVNPRRNPDRPVPGVSVWTLDADGHRDRYLGWAYLDGRGFHGRGNLAHALRANPLSYEEWPD